MVLVMPVSGFRNFLPLELTFVIKEFFFEFCKVSSIVVKNCLVVIPEILLQKNQGKYQLSSPIVGVTPRPLIKELGDHSPEVIATIYKSGCDRLKITALIVARFRFGYFEYFYIFKMLD